MKNLKIPFKSEYKSTPADIKIPGSKSISNRILLMAALAEGESKIQNLLHSDDTRFMMESLQKLGIQVIDEGDFVTVVGNKGNLSNVQRIYTLATLEQQLGF